MPYIEGESLRDRLTREHQLPVEEAVRLAQQIASAPDYAHRCALGTNHYLLPVERRRRVHDLAADDGHQHLRILELHGGNREQVAIDHDEVGELARDE